MVNKVKKSEMKNEIEQVEQVEKVEHAEQSEQRKNVIIDPDEYKMKFGKYKEMKASLLIQDVKGRKYIEWLVSTDWLHDLDKKILNEILTR